MWTLDTATTPEYIWFLAALFGAGVSGGLLVDAVADLRIAIPNNGLRTVMAQSRLVGEVCRFTSQCLSLIGAVRALVSPSGPALGLEHLQFLAPFSGFLLFMGVSIVLLLGSINGRVTRNRVVAHYEDKRP